MGNTVSEFIGNTVSHCGCINAVGFDRAAEAVIRSGDIQPWPAKAMVSSRLEDQARLAKSAPFRTIPVQDGFEHFSSHIGRFSGLSKDEFLDVAQNLIEVRRVSHKGDEIRTLEAVFDSIDFDGDEELTVGEWAGGLTVFFKGTQQEKTSALFQLLDRDNNGCLSKSEMKEYVTPLVKAMTPPEASALRPLLVTHATDKIFDQVDVNNDGKCDANEFNRWRQDHSLVDELVSVIEGEVYKIWLENNMKHPSSPSHSSGIGHSEETRNSIYG
jgi:Ca2+-binding EF-hand superfamily protein